ncbi:MAG: hypothetical protein J5677_04135 [Bacteroidales bacterium]|nr:hypothetical protein [Bacteroidales bacterium]
MKKTLIISSVLLFFAVTTSAQTPTYKELSATAYNLLKGQDYIGAHKAFHTMDSLYGISNFEALYYYYSLSHDFVPDRKVEKTLLFRLARNKCCDMRYLDDWAKRQQADTLDYWNDIVAIVAPRGYQDTVYQNRLLAMNRANNAARQMQNNNQDSVRNAMRMIDSANLSELKQLIAERGFPTWSNVGYYCVIYATAIVLYQPPEFIHWYLEQAKSAAESGDYDPEWLGILIARDRQENVYDTVFYSRIKPMFQADQDARHLLNKGLDEDSVLRVIHEVDSVNLIELKQLIAECGFPTLSRSGYKCCDYAALIAQHSSPEYLHWFLEQAQAAADSGDFIPSWIAYMTDRDLAHQDKPQLYGTQGHTHDGLTGMYLIEDIEHLNERRGKMNLGPIEDYLPHLDMPDFYFHPSLVDYRQYSLNLRIEGDTLRVSGFYLIPYDTTTYSGQPIKVDTAYSLPLADYRTADGAIVLRREGNWYPHINGELLTAQVHIEADDYYILGGTEWLPSFDLHLVLLPKDKYACKVIDTPSRPFHFYRLASDTTQYPDAYYREFVDSYNFYCSFFGDSLSSKPMNIVEIGDPQFVMCQGLRDMIIFGHYFYDVYTMIPDFSWIPHEVAHQWWGDGIFFEYRDYALSESLTEYIKLQYLKSRGRGYEEQMEYYKATMEHAEKTLPIADIRSIESQDESIAIYHAAPYRLTLEDSTSVNTTLQQLYSKYKHTVVSREVFLQECKALQDWLKSE